MYLFPLNNKLYLSSIDNKEIAENEVTVATEMTTEKSGELKAKAQPSPKLVVREWKRIPSA